MTDPFSLTIAAFCVVCAVITAWATIKGLNA